MTHDCLSVLALGSEVERQFSISGRIASWSRSRLSQSMIADSMIYKSYLMRIHTSIKVDIIDNDGYLSVPAHEGEILAK